MAGLLGQNTSGGLLTGLLAQNRGATPDALRRKAEEDRRRAMMMQAQQAPAPARMGMGESFLGFLAGGTEGVHQTRERRRAEALRPEMEAQRQQILASIQDPRERALFLASPEDWAKNVGQQFAPQIVAPGSGQAIGGRLGVEMPSYTESGDQILRRSSQGIEPAYTRTEPSISERIAQQNADSTRMTAERPIELAPGVVALRPDGSQFGQGAPRVFTAADGSDLVQEGVGQIYSNPAERSPTASARPAQAVEIEGRLASLQSEVVPVIDRMEGLLRSGDVITGLGAPQRLLAAKAAAAMGNEDARRQVAATEEYVNTAGRLRVGMAKTLGANPSNADILLLERVTAGDVNQSTDGLLATIQQGRQLAERQRADLGRQLQTFGAASAPAAAPRGQASGPIAEDAQGNRVQWNGSAWVPIR